MARRWDVAHLTVVGLLVWAAYWAALPWIDCVRQFPTADVVRGCSFGVSEVPGGPAALVWNLAVGSVYLLAALWVAFRQR
jgi:hypothetical protein